MKKRREAYRATDPFSAVTHKVFEITVKEVDRDTWRDVSNSLSATWNIEEGFYIGDVE